jgi:hypothetical protein
MKRIRPFLPLFLLCSAVLIALPGCSGERTAKLSGKVTYNNKPVPGGQVVFANEDNTKVTEADIQPDGTYSSTQVPLGKVRVGVMPAHKGLAASIPKGVKSKMPPDKHPEEYEKKGGTEYVDIPEQFRDPSTSGINVTVDGSDKVFNIDIPKK